MLAIAEAVFAEDGERLGLLGVVSLLGCFRSCEPRMGTFGGRLERSFAANAAANMCAARCWAASRESVMRVGGVAYACWCATVVGAHCLAAWTRLQTCGGILMFERLANARISASIVSQSAAREASVASSAGKQRQRER
jgi:hypothetical protein